MNLNNLGKLSFTIWIIKNGYLLETPDYPWEEMPLDRPIFFESLKEAGEAIQDYLNELKIDDKTMRVKIGSNSKIKIPDNSRLDNAG